MQGKDGKSTFLAIDRGANMLGRLRDIPRLEDSEAICIPEDMDPVNNYVFRGHIPVASSDIVAHFVFAEVRPWRISDSFSDLLDKKDMCRLLTPLVLVDVFEIILTAYLDFEEVRHSCQYPQLKDYQTYFPPRYDDNLNIAESSTERVWQTPYWSCSLGTPKALRIPGASREAQERDEFVVRLGLVLFQLGSHSKAILDPGP